MIWCVECETLSARTVRCYLMTEGKVYDGSLDFGYGWWNILLI